MAGIETDLQHHGEDRERQHGAVAPAVYRTSLFTFPDSAAIEAYYRGDRRRFSYTRDSNPTLRVLEEKIARLERTDDAIACASGMGAISAVLLAHLSAGDHLVLFARAYGPALVFARDILPRFGVDVTWIAPEELGRLDSVLNDRTRLIYVESPASLTMDVIDLAAIASIARARGIVTATDNSWASPIFQQPISAGIDLVVHSGTKYIAGHSDVVLGLLAGSAAAIDRVRALSVLLGATLSADDAALAIRGLRTLALRMARHDASARALARRLEAHPKIARVLHPALESFPGHALWKRQFQGASGLFSFVVDGDPRAFCDALRVFLIGVSWGGYESLALPVITTMPDPARRVRPDVDPRLVRISVGLEDPRDLEADLERGLSAL